MKDKLAQFEEPQTCAYKCLTELPGFQSNCLDIYVLEKSYYDYIHTDREPGD